MVAPIVLFVYNRPEHTEETISSLQKNELAKDSELFIYSDEAKNVEARNSVDEVRKYIKTVSGFKKVTIIEREENYGLANSIIDGVSNIINDYGKVIVLEDDLITSPKFLKYMNDSLNVFENRKDIFSVTGFNYPKELLKIPFDYKDDIFLSFRCMSWSWATWKDRWDKVDWELKDFEQLRKNKGEIIKFNRGGKDLFPMLKNQLLGKIDSWAIRFCYAHSVNNSYCVYPVKSYINNEGFDGSGVHCGNDSSKKLKNLSLCTTDLVFNKDIILNDAIVKNFYLINKKSILQKIKSLVRRFI